MRKTLKCFVLTALVLGMATFANAGPRKPPDCDGAIDDDSDGWCVPDPSNKSVTVDMPDCNDADPNVHPGANETLNNGVDDDCNQETPDVFPLYAKAFCGGRPTQKCVNIMEAEIAACVDSGHCTVRKTTGTFDTDEGYYLVDANCDGVRGVVDQDAYDEFVAEGRKRTQNPNWQPRKDGRCMPSCKGSSATAKSVKSPVTPSPAVPTVDGRIKKVEDTLAPIGELLTATVAKVGEHDTALAEQGNKITALRADLTAEKAAREHADADTHLRINSTNAKAQYALEKASWATDLATSALAQNAYADLSVGYALVGNKGMRYLDQTLRSTSAQGGLVLGRVGAEIPGGRLLLAGSLALIMEESLGNNRVSLLGRVGPEVVFPVIGGVDIGIGAGYLSHLSGGDVVGANAESRGAFVELSLGGAIRLDSIRFPVRIALAGIAEELGTRGTTSGGQDFRHAAFGWGSMFTATIGGAVGAQGVPTRPAIDEPSDDDGG